MGFVDIPVRADLRKSSQGFWSSIASLLRRILALPCVFVFSSAQSRDKKCRARGYDKRNVIEAADDYFEVVTRAALATDYGDDICPPDIGELLANVDRRVASRERLESLRERLKQ
jgi:hypothetical protein